MMSLKPVAGINVSKSFSEIAILSPSNEVVARMRINHDSNNDVKRAVKLLKKVKKDFDSRPHVVMESTGYYHKTLFHSLIEFGFEISIIMPIQTDSIKNIGIRKVKNDKVDARKIALLYRFQKLEASSIPNQDIECLKSLCRQYYKLSDELTMYKNRFTGIVNQLMLNFKDVFSDIYSKTAIAVLEAYPTPVAIIKTNRNKLIDIIKTSSRKGPDRFAKKCEQLVLKAKEFKPLSLDNPANIAMLGVYISMIKSLEENLDRILKAIRELINNDLAKDKPIHTVPNP